MDYREDSPEILLDFLSYHETIKAHSQRTVDEYYLDLRNFFRYLKWTRDPALQEQPMESVDIRDVDLTFVGSVTLTEIYAYMSYLSRDRVLHPNSDRSAKGLNPTSRARKLATIRSFYGYLCNKVHKLDRNPVKDIDAPKLKKTLPRYLTLDESISLLESVDGPKRERDLCILTLFLNCGLRISELIGLNLSDIHEDALRVLGKGNKVRMVYLNQACLDTLRDYLAVRRPITGPDRPVPVGPQPTDQPLHGQRPGEKAPVPGGAGQHPVFLPQAAPHRRHPDAAKRRGRAGGAGGPGPRAPEYHGNIHPYRQRGPAGGCKGKSLVTGEDQRENQG